MGKLEESSKRSARNAAMPTSEGRCNFRTVENNAERVTTYADDSEFRCCNGRTRTGAFMLAV